jgi:hypothetical protein
MKISRSFIHCLPIIDVAVVPRKGCASREAVGFSAALAGERNLSLGKDSFMARNRLRVYYGPDEVRTTEGQESSPRQMVSVPVGDVLPLLLEASRNRRAWLEDFADDEMTISSDLYEVLLAYQHFRRPSA